MEKLDYVLLSGGLDSAYALLRLCKNEKKQNAVTPLFFDYGQKNNQFEEKAASLIIEYLISNTKKIINSLKIIRCRAYTNFCYNADSLFPWSLSEPMNGDKKNSHNFLHLEIENRNMVLYSIFVSYVMSELRKNNIYEAEIDVHTGFRNNEMPDSTDEYFNTLNCALFQYHPKFKFKLNFIDDISQIYIYESLQILLGSEQRAKDFFELTISCYTPKSDGSPCNMCTKCGLLNEIHKKQKKLKDENLL